jgi:hypothetical protein
VTTNEVRTSELRWTVLALRGGGLLAVALFGVALVLRLAVLAEAAATVSWAGVLVVIATPPAALVATAAETWRHQRPTALLALAVLVVLGGAAIVALALSR